MKTKNVLVIGVPYDEDDPYYTNLQRMASPIRTMVIAEVEQEPVLYDKNERPLTRRRRVGFR